MQQRRLLTSQSPRPRLSSRRLSHTSAKEWTERLQTLSDVLAGCKTVAQATPVPGLPAFIGIAQGIVNTVEVTPSRLMHTHIFNYLQNARTNRENALRLATRVCELLKLLAEHSQQYQPLPNVTDESDTLGPAYVNTFCLLVHFIHGP